MSRPTARGRSGRRKWALTFGVVLLAGAAAAAWLASPRVVVGQLVDVTGQPVTSAAVQLVSTTPLLPDTLGGADSDGRYRLASRWLPFRPPRLHVVAPDYVPVQTGGGRLVLHRWPRLAGQVVDEAASPIAGAVVTVESPTGQVQAAMTGLDGSFRMVLPGLTGNATVTGLVRGHDPAAMPLALALDGESTVQLKLSRQFATMHVESDPGGQAPLVDGVPAPECPATPCDARVLVGAHRLSFAGDLFVPWQQDVRVTKGATVSVQAQLLRKTGVLRLVAPPGGELTVDGQDVAGPAWSGTLETGQHVVTYRSPSTWPYVARPDVAWNAEADLTVQPTPVAAGNPGAFIAALRSYLAAQGGGSYGVYLEDLASGTAVGDGEGDPLEAASVIKLPVALYLLHLVDVGRAELNGEVDLQEADFMGGTGSLDGTASPGDRYSYGQLLALMIQQSDNTAWQALLRVLGTAQIDDYAAALGAGDCHQVSDVCSARSAGHLLAQLGRGQLLGAASTQRLLNLLETTIFNDRINWYLPGMTIAHKVGMNTGVRNDCGIVFQPARPFVVCVFTTNPDEDQATIVIRDIARAAAAYYGR